MSANDANLQTGSISSLSSSWVSKASESDQQSWRTDAVYESQIHEHMSSLEASRPSVSPMSLIFKHRSQYLHILAAITAVRLRQTSS